MFSKCTTNWQNVQLKRATHPKVKTVERGVKVVLGSKTIHFHRHLHQEQAQKYKLRKVCPEEINIADSIAAVPIVNKTQKETICVLQKAFESCVFIHVLLQHSTQCFILLPATTWTRVLVTKKQIQATAIFYARKMISPGSNNKAGTIILMECFKWMEGWWATWSLKPQTYTSIQMWHQQS